MLTRLEQSEPTTVWYGLWDKVLAERSLQAAFWAVWHNAGAPGDDGQTFKQFEEQAQAELARLRDELRHKRYRHQPARRVWIPKPGTTERHPLDHAVAQQGWAMVRYAHDLVVPSRTRAEAQTVLDYVRYWTAAAGLTLHPTKTRLVHAGKAASTSWAGTFAGGRNGRGRKAFRNCRTNCAR